MKKIFLFALLAIFWIPSFTATASSPPPPRVYLYFGGGTIGDPLAGPYHFKIGNELFVWVTVDTVGSPSETADVYVGAALPNGQFASWVNNGTDPPIWKAAAIPLPLMKSVQLDTTPIPSSLDRVFSDDDPFGFYIIYALLVYPGKDPLDTRNWISVGTVPFTLNPSLAIPQSTR